MLSANSLLRQGRYRVSQLIASSGSQTIYEAADQQTGKSVLVCEKVGLSGFGNSRPDHPGLVSIAERFDENGYAYLVTEPMAEVGPWRLKAEERTEAATLAACDRLRTILEGLILAHRHFPSIRSLDITPRHFRNTESAGLKFAFFETSASDAPQNSDSPFAALETVWEKLDRASQKVVTHDYDEAELDDLEASPDARSDLYATAGVFYYLLTGRSPASALERAIELIDSGKDPLIDPTSLNQYISTPFARSMAKMMALKRTDRFPSIESAVFALPAANMFSAPAHTASHERTSVQKAETFELDVDDLDILDIVSDLSADTVSETAKTPAHLDEKFPTFDLREEVVEDHPEPFIDSLHATDAVQHLTEDAVIAITEEPNSPTHEISDLFAKNHAEPVMQPAFVQAETEPDTEPEPLSVPEQRPIFVQPDNDDDPLELDLGDHRRSPFKLLALAAVVLIAVVGTAFFLLSGSKPDAQDKTASRTAESVPTAASEPLQPASQTAAQTDTADTADRTQPLADTQQNAAHADFQPNADKPAEPAAAATQKQRPQIADAKPVKPADTKPTPDTAAKAKKKVTVDDLINDN